MEREALKLALEVLENLPGFRADIDNAKDVIKAALAQPAQEPVANDRALQLVTHQLNHWVAYATELRERLNKYEGGAPMLLNITPPQRTWVNLTDDEAQWLYDTCRTPSNLIDMVEAKLKDKNNG